MPGNPWYRTGTVNVSNGSVNLVFVDTLLTVNAAQGDTFWGPDGKAYELDVITDDTHAALKTAYLGATLAAQNYAISRNFASISLPAQLASSLQSLLNKFHVYLDQMLSWLTGSGSVTLTDAVGNSYSVQTPTALQAALHGRLSKNVAGSTATIALTSTEASNRQIVLTGARTAALTLTIPDGTTGDFYVDNQTTGGYDVTVKTVSGTGLVVKPGKGITALCADGTNVVLPTANTAGGLSVGNGTGALVAGSATLSGCVDLSASATFPATGVFHRASDGKLHIVAGASGINIDSASGGATWGSWSSGGLSVTGTGTFSGAVIATSGVVQVPAGTVGIWNQIGSDTARVRVSGVDITTVSSTGLAVAGVLNITGPASSASPFNVGGTNGNLVYCGASNESINAGESASMAVLFIRKNFYTARSINAAGTINASGADYAEYIRKAIGCGAVEKGAVIGIDAQGRITDKWSAALSYGIKSTNPSLVGGDVWGSADQIGVAPVEPIYTAPAYEGTADPGEAPVEPILGLPVEPVMQAGETDETFAVFRAAWLRKCDDLQLAFAAAHERWQTDLTVWQDASAKYRIDQQVHAARVATAETAHAELMDSYKRERAAFAERLELARQTVDREGFTGLVPVAVLGAAPGDYILASEGPDNTIIGIVATKAQLKADMSLYLDAVGRVRQIMTEADAKALCQRAGIADWQRFVGMAVVAVIKH